MRDFLGREVTMEEARILKAHKAPTGRKDLIGERLARGLHPHNASPLRTPPGETCGSCALHLVKDFHRKRYHKCSLTPNSNGEATDIRIRWPACSSWKPTQSDARSAPETESKS